MVLEQQHSGRAVMRSGDQLIITFVDSSGKITNLEVLTQGRLMTIEHKNANQHIVIRHDEMIFVE